MAVTDSKGRRAAPERSEKYSVRSKEGRQLACELHDSASSLLAALQLHLGHLRQAGRPDTHPLIDECERIVEEVHEHMRALILDR